MQIVTIFDHALLSPIASASEISILTQKAKDAKFPSICVPPCYVKQAKFELVDTLVKVGTVVGFPNGMNTIETKVFETLNAIQNGADLIVMVVNISLIKSNDLNSVKEELVSVRKASQGNELHVLLYTRHLTENELMSVSELIHQLELPLIMASNESELIEETGGSLHE